MLLGKAYRITDRGILRSTVSITIITSLTSPASLPRPMRRPA